MEKQRLLQTDQSTLLDQEQLPTYTEAKENVSTAGHPYVIMMDSNSIPKQDDGIMLPAFTSCLISFFASPLCSLGTYFCYNNPRSKRGVLLGVGLSALCAGILLMMIGSFIEMCHPVQRGNEIYIQCQKPVAFLRFGAFLLCIGSFTSGLGFGGICKYA